MLQTSKLLELAALTLQIALVPSRRLHTLGNVRREGRVVVVYARLRPTDEVKDEVAADACRLGPNRGRVELVATCRKALPAGVLD